VLFDKPKSELVKLLLLLLLLMTLLLTLRLMIGVVTFATTLRAIVNHEQLKNYLQFVKADVFFILKYYFSKTV
jgi:hypothetical protein